MPKRRLIYEAQYHKKVISAMLSGVLMLSLAGCGKAAKLPETVVNTSLVVEKDGK